MRMLPLTCVLAAVMLAACSDSETDVVDATVDPENFATMTTTDVSTLISDSGVTRYRIEAPLWLMFEEAAEPRWTFPSGLYLEKFNDLFVAEATVWCDSAVFLKNRQLWRLDGYVEIQNLAGEKFLTPQLFWDQRNSKIYSDSFIHIERDGRIIEGYGFISDDRMSHYNVLRVSGIFPADRFAPGGGRNEADSVEAERDRQRHDSVRAFTDSVRRLPGSVNTIEPSRRNSQRRPLQPMQQTTGGASQTVMPGAPAPKPKRGAPHRNYLDKPMIEETHVIEKSPSKIPAPGARGERVRRVR